VQATIDLDLNLIDAYNKELAKIEWHIKKHAKQYNPTDYHILKSISGVGDILALTILSEIGDIQRFESVQRFASYSRLIKCKAESAGKTYGTQGNKIGNAHLNLLKAISQADIKPPPTPKHWVAQCKSVGSGLPALQYLSRYLYRGVIRNCNIGADDGEQVGFRYRDSDSGKIKTRTLLGEDFLALLLQHTLPKGCRRSRDYGFLHGNGKALLALIHWVLKFAAPEFVRLIRPAFICPKCQGDMVIMGFKRKPCPG